MDAKTRHEQALAILRTGTVIPATTLGLDENGFVSARGTCKKPTDVYVMSEAAFKLFDPSAKDTVNA